MKKIRIFFLNLLWRLEREIPGYFLICFFLSHTQFTLSLQGIQLNDEMVAFFKERLINTLKTLNIIHWASLFGGFGFAAICLIYYVVNRRETGVNAVEAPLK